MTPALLQFSPALDLFPLIAGLLACIACALLGNFLVLRRISLMGDAISHSVLPGLVIAFLIASTRNPLVMFAGAAIAGVATVVLVEIVKRLGRVEPGAAMGVVFSVLFAVGVLLIERAAVRHIDLDADCVLHGQLETLVWYDAPATLGAYMDPVTWLGTADAAGAPPQVWVLLATVLAAILFIGMLFKELRIAAFDPQLATTQGFNATLIHYLLMVFVAAATVASFEAVGSILVIAMLICPAATARLLTDRLLPQIICSVVVAIITGVGGYFAASSVPAWFERDAVNAAGSMAVVAGVLLTLAIIASPRHGVIRRVLLNHRLAARIARDDLLAAAFRAAERHAGPAPAVLTFAEIDRVLVGRGANRAIRRAVRRGLITASTSGVTLTPIGNERARDVIRRHRLWEDYLVREAGVAPDHVHQSAEQLEHVDQVPPAGPREDPHGQRIPNDESTDRSG